jgi:HEAT repeat protein
MWPKHKRAILLLGVAAVLGVVLVVTYWGPSQGSLIRQAQEGSAADRAVAIESLQGRHSQQAAEAMAALVQDSDTAVARQAVEAVGRARRPQDLPTLKAAAADKRPEVRESVVIAVGRNTAPESVAVLVAALRSDPVPEVRTAAAQALGMRREWDAMPDLINALVDPSERVRTSAGAAVRRMWERDFGYRASDPPDKCRHMAEVIRAHWEDLRRSPMYARLTGRAKEKRP